MLLLTVFFTSLLLPAVALAGDFTVQTGYSNTNPSGVRFFRVATFDRPVTQVLLGYSWTIHEWKHAKLTYHADIIPLMRISDPGEREILDITDSINGNSHFDGSFRTFRTVKAQNVNFVGGDPLLPQSGHFEITPFRAATYGGGANPVATEVFFRPRRRVQPFATMTVGFLVFPHDEPVENTSYFNFSYAFGGGVDYRLRDRRALTVGYKLLHMSNAALGAFNPGVNSNFIYVGYRFGR